MCSGVIFFDGQSNYIKQQQKTNKKIIFRSLPVAINDQIMYLEHRDKSPMRLHLMVNRLIYKALNEFQKSNINLNFGFNEFVCM